MKRFFFVICISLFSLCLFAQKAYVASHGETEMLLLIYPESNKWILFTEYNKSAKRFSGKLTKDEEGNYVLKHIENKKTYDLTTYYKRDYLGDGEWYTDFSVYNTSVPEGTLEKTLSAFSDSNWISFGYELRLKSNVGLQQIISNAGLWNKKPNLRMKDFYGRIGVLNVF